MATTSTRLTYADLVAMPEDGKRHELIDGEHYVTPAPTLRHQLVLAHLHLDLGGYVEANGLEWVEVHRAGSAGKSGLHPAARLLRERGDGPLTSPLFPGFALQLDRLFR